MENTLKPRLHYIDWLRVLIVLSLIPLHSAIVFIVDPSNPAFIKDTANSEFMVRMVEFLNQFNMPLMFVLAGMSSYLSLSGRTAGQYSKERIGRLLVPIVFGTIVLIPPMTYLSQLWKGEDITFWEHYARFFTQTDYGTGLDGGYTPGHLWFIMFLVIFSFLALPLFVRLKKRPPQKLVKVFSKRFTLLIPGVFLTLAAVMMTYTDMNPIVYLLYFLLGFILMSGEGCMNAVKRDWPYLLPAAVIFEVLRQILPYPPGQFSALWLLRGLMEHTNRWIMVLVLLGVGARFLNRGGKVLSYLSEAAYPLYILHMLPNTLAAFFAVRLETYVAVKYIIIALATFAVLFPIYELVRRLNFMRFLLGMKLIKRARGKQQTKEFGQPPDEQHHAFNKSE